MANNQTLQKCYDEEIDKAEASSVLLQLAQEGVHTAKNTHVQSDLILVQSVNGAKGVDVQADSSSIINTPDISQTPSSVLVGQETGSTVNSAQAVFCLQDSATNMAVGTGSYVLAAIEESPILLEPVSYVKIAQEGNDYLINLLSLFFVYQVSQEQPLV